MWFDRRMSSWSISSYLSKIKFVPIKHRVIKPLLTYNLYIFLGYSIDSECQDDTTAVTVENAKNVSKWSMYVMTICVAQVSFVFVIFRFIVLIFFYVAKMILITDWHYTSSLPNLGTDKKIVVYVVSSLTGDYSSTHDMMWPLIMYSQNNCLLATLVRLQLILVTKIMVITVIINNYSNGNKFYLLIIFTNCRTTIWHLNIGRVFHYVFFLDSITYVIVLYVICVRVCVCAHDSEMLFPLSYHFEHIYY